MAKRKSRRGTGTTGSHPQDPVLKDTCVYCKTEESLFSLACERHSICRECLPNNIEKFGSKRDEMYICPECTGATTGQPPHVLIFADNSNIWIEAMKHAGDKKGFRRLDHRVRIDYSRVRDIVSESAVVKEATLYGSVPPPVDTFWERVRRCDWTVKTYERSSITGEEKEVDTKLVADVTEVVCKTRPGLRGTIIILSGDRDMLPAAEKSLENGWKVQMYIWKNSAHLRTSLDEYAKKYPKCVSYKYLDDIEAQVTFLNRELSENPQDDIYNCSAVISIKEGKTVDEIIKDEKWWKELENFTKWPVEYRRVKDGDKNRHLLLVFQDMERHALEKFVEKQKLRYVEQCQLYSKSLQKSGYVEGEEGYKTKVPRLKPQKPRAAATSVSSTKPPSSAQPSKTTKSTIQSCCSGKNCDSGLMCRFTHTDDDRRYFERRGGIGNILRKTRQCRNYHNGGCKYLTIRCEFAHEEIDRWCVNCHESGHFSKDCTKSECQHPRHSQSS